MVKLCAYQRILFETGSHVVQPGLKLPVYLRIFFFRFICVLYVHAVYMPICLHKLEEGVRCSFFFILTLRQGPSVTLELGSQSARASCLHFPPHSASYRQLRPSRLFTWVLEIQTQVPRVH